MARSPPLPEPADEDLVARCRTAGDHEAFALLVERHQQGICRFVARMTGPAGSEDLAQDVFIRAHQALPRFRGDSSFRTWIYSIARNRCCSELRRRGRRIETVPLTADDEETMHPLLSDSPPDFAADIARKDVSARVTELVAALPLPYRQVLTLFYVDEMQYEEIAAVLDVPMGTVKTWLHRARLRLRDLVVADGTLTTRGSEPTAGAGFVAVTPAPRLVAVAPAPGRPVAVMRRE
jgi:RNA polymerase sigma-70 factor (ECF subfamily)